MIYDHECEKCGKTHEVWCKVDKRDESDICQCGGKTHRIVTTNGTGFALKGDNWASGEAKRRWGDSTNYQDIRRFYDDRQ